jgi:hypothetical protein
MAKSPLDDPFYPSAARYGGKESEPPMEVFEVSCKNAPSCTNTYRYITTSYEEQELLRQLLDAGWTFDYDYYFDLNGEVLKDPEGRLPMKIKSYEFLCLDCKLPPSIKRIKTSPVKEVAQSPRIPLRQIPFKTLDNEEP